MFVSKHIMYALILPVGAVVAVVVVVAVAVVAVAVIAFELVKLPSVCWQCKGRACTWMAKLRRCKINIVILGNKYNNTKRPRRFASVSPPSRISCEMPWVQTMGRAVRRPPASWLLPFPPPRGRMWREGTDALQLGTSWPR